MKKYELTLADWWNLLNKCQDDIILLSFIEWIKNTPQFYSDMYINGLKYMLDNNIRPEIHANHHGVVFKNFNNIIYDYLSGQNHEQLECYSGKSIFKGYTDYADAYFALFKAVHKYEQMSWDVEKILAEKLLWCLQCDRWIPEQNISKIKIDRLECNTCKNKINLIDTLENLWDIIEIKNGTTKAKI